MKKLMHIIQVSIAKYYYEWGNEPIGYVTYGKYSEDGSTVDIGWGPKEWAQQAGIPFNCPYP